jgi:hypothetical protein
MLESPEQTSAVPTYDMNLSEAWDQDSQVELFFKKLKKLGLYNKNNLYSGFNGENFGIQTHSDEEAGTVFCSPESYFTNPMEQNPFVYAMDFEKPAIGIYDPNKLEWMSAEHYRIKDPSALIAVIFLN